MKNKIFKNLTGILLGGSLLFSLASLNTTNVKAEENIKAQEVEQKFSIKDIKLNITNINTISNTFKNSIDYLNFENKINIIEQKQLEKNIDSLVDTLDIVEKNDTDILKDKIVESKIMDNTTKIDNQTPISMKDSLMKNINNRNELVKEEERLEKERLEQLEREKQEQIRLEAIKKEEERLENERKEKLRLEAIKKEKEAKRLASLTTYTAKENVNMRMYADKDSKLMGMINKGDTFEAYDFNDKWVEVIYKNQSVYVSSAYIKEGKHSTVNSTNKVTENKTTNKTSNNKIYNLTNDERVLLEKLVEAEAGGQSYEGKLAVATVIANRVEMKGSFDNTITSVIYAKNQFSPTFDGRLEKMKPSQSTKNAISAVFDNGQRNLPKDIVFFCTNAVREYSWINTRAFYAEIGDHSFFYKHAK